MRASSETPDLKAELRARLVAERERLHPHQRLQLDRRICAHLLRYLDERDGLNLAGFHAFRGEPDLMPALEALHQAGRRIHLPVVDGSHMEFRRWTPGQALRRNRFGIPEPLDGKPCPIERLDVVFMPLVAFSPSGTRLGMGAGFYDRAFEFRLSQPGQGPSLIGTAYSLQEVDSLPAQHWDVPIDGVITDRGLKRFTED
ncbi:5-formyltetrahydrofolate cyclo-ligase [Wenzhouxiangella marina]|uniref:5-formyltetrahydrofolate cyclo-ligase n=1 Tax=Wenzhouxiangella marina TaxID=1579979 RepID=A0A0K0XUR4_9GAMM|nr:5-formyltetrahydrofolate cyclo-ligase [Wenzhouxiangella marina]AKS41423.1 5-formyltetrahydrofolate cyclo-ligase [Wenzhouxiangella marina]MBB6086823.1 5-formyltetrahydrofolate cyclo-ligase [Wenzhouxiangella marina]